MQAWASRRGFRREEAAMTKRGLVDRAEQRQRFTNNLESLTGEQRTANFERELGNGNCLNT
jgi:hypothetical protein